MKKQKTQLPELGCVAPVSATADMRFTVGLQQMFGMVRITWSMDPRYPITNAVAQVKENGGDGVQNHVITSHSGYFDTNFAWGTGYVGVLWGCKCNGDYILITSTPATS